MSLISKHCRLFLIVALVFPGLAEAQAQSECDRGVCRYFVKDKRQISSPCEGSSLIVGYSQSSGATVIQCENTSGTADENPTLLFDRYEASHPAFEFVGGRFLTANAEDWELFQSEGIPDKFGPKPLCERGPRQPADGEFLIGVKRLRFGEDPDPPYCYDLYLINGNSNAWMVTSASGVALQPLSPQGFAKWKTLKEKLVSSVDTSPKGASASVKTLGTVVSDKAHLYASPEMTAITKMYLVKGDRVDILDESKRASEWIRIRYTAKSGKSIEKWVKTGDIETFGK
ncbi:MAG: hypothetical protein LUQ11_12505 [Methylococcaceae bacterium]|nr:hypothetical protein [Methylococcaceae bacterium]